MPDRKIVDRPSVDSSIHCRRPDVLAPGDLLHHVRLMHPDVDVAGAVVVDLTEEGR